MPKRKRWKVAAAIVVVVLAGDFALSQALHIARVRRSLTARFQAAFGRPVQVGNFNLRLLPSPRLEAEGVTVSDDPGFGYEYFLRAERVTAGLRWSGLLRGRLEFGTFSFTRPSLNLVRSNDGKWNLERWLPPAHGARVAPFGPQPLASPSVQLDRVDFDAGRVNFMTAADKLPFAFTEVTGSVEQVSPGRWMLQLEAQPWRSGVALQAAGTLQVRGDLAGTSARLQPAQIHVHWSEASLADLLRLARGDDSGLRGQITLDATARSAPSGSPASNEWTFGLQARGQGIHRWDLSERRDNPAVNLLLDGRWNVPNQRLLLEKIVLEGPKSNARGSGEYSLGARPNFELRVDSAGVQAADLLAWVRAFQPDVAEGAAADAYFTAAAELDGWPLQWKELAIASSGGTLTLPVLSQPIRIGPVEGGRVRNRLALDPVMFDFGAALPEPERIARGKGQIISTRKTSQPVAADANAILFSASLDLPSHSGFWRLSGKTGRVQDVLSATAALGRPVARGWYLEGGAAADLRWDWDARRAEGQRLLSGHIDFLNDALQVAGLNLPVEIGGAQLYWDGGTRGVKIAALQAFGAHWSGDVVECGEASTTNGAEAAQKWQFQLRADRVDATELDRWVGPRARPGWLERLLATFNGPAAPQTSASQLIRQIRATGDLQLDELRVEKFVLEDVRAHAALSELRLNLAAATAQWAGGTLGGAVTADFTGRPRYTVELKAERVHLGELSGVPRGHAPPFDGTATVMLRLTTEGVGREELLKSLAGAGRVELKNVELRGWDLSASVGDGAARPGTSRWSAGAGTFGVRDRTVWIDPLQLDAANGASVVRGTVSFERATELSFVPLAKQARAAAHSTPGNYAQVSGPLDALELSIVAPDAEPAAKSNHTGLNGKGVSGR